MAQEKELEIGGGVLKYEIGRQGIVILGLRAVGGSIRIPDEIENLPVIRMERKALLSCKAVRELYLPACLEEIGDWAFAYCSNLKTVYLPKRKLVLGKGIFKECENLECICHLSAVSKEEIQAGYLLGAVPVKLEADYLFTPEEAGEKHWISRFDDRLEFFLYQSDEEGYVKQVYCGEEDIMSNLDLYLAERRRAKSRLCFMRLIHNVALGNELREKLETYLAEHTKGCVSEAAWEVLRGERGNEKTYYEIFMQAGCVNDDNYDGILQDMGEEYPEMKAYLMSYKAEQMVGEDFFASLSLDF
jgi:hypothetical protein